jgi:hypothetical protein
MRWYRLDEILLSTIAALVSRKNPVEYRDVQDLSSNYSKIDTGKKCKRFKLFSNGR